jgi:hypothetical protein
VAEEKDEGLVLGIAMRRKERGGSGTDRGGMRPAATRLRQAWAAQQGRGKWGLTNGPRGF